MQNLEIILILKGRRGLNLSGLFISGILKHRLTIIKSPNFDTLRINVITLIFPYEQSI